MTGNTLAAQLSEKLFGTSDSSAPGTKAHLTRVAVQLLAEGEPITCAQLAAASGLTEVDLQHTSGGQDIEYDEQGRIIGCGLTSNPTPHKFIVDGRRFYTWCAPDTLIFPALIGRIAKIESLCPTIGTIIRLTVDPDAGITALKPSTAVVSIVDPGQVDPDAVRATVCNPQHFFASAEAARDWQSRHPGMSVLPVGAAYTLIMRPLADAMLSENPPRKCC